MESSYSIIGVNTEDLLTNGGKAAVASSLVESHCIDGAILEMYLKGYKLKGITSTRGCRKDSQHLYHFIRQE